VPTKQNHSNTSAASLDKLQERETWYKLVVKIINWKDGFLGENVKRAHDKVTAKEWSLYSKGMTSSNTTYSKEKVSALLNETKAKIKEHGGFEEEVK
jgi:hypothetical protein